MAANGREIERKYLLRGLPTGIAEHRSIEIDQGYVPGTSIRERLRRITGGDGVSYVRTVKVGTGMDRFEFEEETTREFFEAVWPLTRGKRVYKRRYLVPVPEGLWEIDEFLDRELVLAEFEMDSADQRVEVPAFLREVLVREVTDDSAYGNFRLAR
jgi:adenylate cyclase